MRFPTKLKGERIALHATAKFTPDSMMKPDLIALCEELFGVGFRHSLTRSAILGTVRLKQCHATDDLRDEIDMRNLLAGDWTPGRFAWELTDINSLTQAVPAKGKQGWWSHDDEPLTFEIINEDKRK